MSIPDPIAALVAFLKADADVKGQVGARVFGGELPRAETDSMPRKAIVLRPAGGPQMIGRGYQEYGDLRVDVFAYGATPHEAFDVWRALHPALKQLVRQVEGEALIHRATPAGGPTALRDPDAEWPYVFSSWQVLAAEVAVG